MTGEANETSELKSKQGPNWTGWLTETEGQARTARTPPVLCSCSALYSNRRRRTLTGYNRERSHLGWVLGAGGWGLGGQLLTKVNKKQERF